MEVLLLIFFYYYYDRLVHFIYFLLHLPNSDTTALASKKKL
jgi:hypothetical protein